MSVELENNKAYKEEASAPPLADLPTLDLLATPIPSNFRQGNSNLLSSSDGSSAKTLAVSDPFKLSLDLSTTGTRAQAAPPAKAEPGTLKLSDPFSSCPRPSCPFDAPPATKNDMSKIPTLKELLAELEVKEKTKEEKPGADQKQSENQKAGGTAGTDQKAAGTDQKPVNTDQKQSTDQKTGGGAGEDRKTAGTDQKPAVEQKLSETKPSAESKPGSDTKVADTNKTAEIVEPRDGKGGRTAVQSYEQKQGGRIAGSNVAPPIDFAPRTLPSNTVPSTIPDSRTNPTDTNYRPKPQDSFTPLQPGENRPLVPQESKNGPMVIPDANVKPAEYRPDTKEQIDKLETRFETDNAAEAIKMAKELGLPLAVHVGASWCGPCQTMDKHVWPAIEGPAGTANSLKGKVVTLHIDVDQMKELTGEARQAANRVASGVGSLPTIRVFSVDQGTGKLTQKVQGTGGKSIQKLTELLQQGGVRK